MVWSARLNLERMIKGVGEVSYYGFHCGCLDVWDPKYWNSYFVFTPFSRYTSKKITDDLNL